MLVDSILEYDEYETREIFRRVYSISSIELGESFIDDIIELTSGRTKLILDEISSGNSDVTKIINGFDRIDFNKTGNFITANHKQDVRYDWISRVVDFYSNVLGNSSELDSYLPAVRNLFDEKSLRSEIYHISDLEIEYSSGVVDVQPILAPMVNYINLARRDLDEEFIHAVFQIDL